MPLLLLNWQAIREMENMLSLEFSPVDIHSVTNVYSAGLEMMMMMPISLLP